MPRKLREKGGIAIYIDISEMSRLRFRARVSDSGAVV
jgi:hypothetical protein